MICATSCNKSSQFKVGFLLPNMVSGRYLKEKVYFAEKIKEANGEAIIVSADYNPQRQIDQADSLLKEGAKVLVLNPLNLNTAAVIIRESHKYNVPVIAYDRLIKNCDLDFFISFDNVKVGKLMADYIINLKPEGNYILLGGDKSDQNAVWVKKGQMESLSPYVNSGKIKIAYDIYVEDWSGDNANHEMKINFNLSGTYPDAILSSYDGMSTGVINLIKAHNIKPGQILISGQDAELDACRNIVSGYQTMTIYKSVKNLAYKAAQIAIQLVNNEKVSSANTTTNNGFKEVPTVLLDPVVVDASNLKTTVIADGFLSESDIYK
jgi:D-xylose ABC transporter substrate-binding protein